MMKKYFLHLGVGGLLLLGAFLRFDATLLQRDYWYDEAFTGILLKAPWTQMNQMIYADVHPPLYYWLVKIFAMPFDYSPTGIRYFSVLFGLATIFSIFWIGRKMWGVGGALVATFLVVISPFAVQYSQEARMYSLFGFLMLWAVWFFYQALEKKQIKDWLLWGLFCGLAFYTHYLALFFFVMFYLAYVLYHFLEVDWTVKNSKNIIKIFFAQKGWWVGVGVIGLFLASWLKVFLFHLSRTGGDLGWIAPSNFSDLPKTLQIFFFGHPAGVGGTPEANSFRFFFDSGSVGLIILVFLVALFVAVWTKNIKRKPLIVLCCLSLGTLLFLVILSHLGIKFYVARYFMPAAIILYLLLGGLISQVLKSNWARLFVLGLYVFLILMLNHRQYNRGWYEFAEQYKNHVDQEGFIILTNPFEYTSARYYFSEQKVRLFNRNNPTESFAGWVVVGDKNRLMDFSQVEALGNSLILDSTCDWQKDKLQTFGKAGQYKLCKLN